MEMESFLHDIAHLRECYFSFRKFATNNNNWSNSLHGVNLLEHKIKLCAQMY